MAKFTQKPGSAGTFNAEESTLTLKLGETAELILSGGGSPQAPRLRLALSASVRARASEDKSATPQPDQRRFSITPLDAGTLVVGAMSGPKPAEGDAPTLRMIVLPRVESSLAPEHLILFSGLDAKDDTIQEAYNKMRSTAPTALVYDISSLNRLVQILEQYRDTGRRIHKLEWISHGSAGRLAISASDWLDSTPSRMQLLRGKSFENLFTAGSRTFFHGCNVADGSAGPELLAGWGRVFNVKFGGTVAASTSLGFTLGHSPFNGKTYHLWGNTVRFHFAPGGKITDVEGVSEDVKKKYVTH